MVVANSGVGDVLATARPACTIVSEIKKVGHCLFQNNHDLRSGAHSSTSEAPAKYQNLLIEFERLSRVFSRLFDLRPVRHELKNLEAIRAAVAACQRPLKEFLGKISRFDKTLGVWDAKDKRFKGFGRRIQFNAAFEEDAHKLRLTIATHVSTISTLLSLETM